MRRFFATLGTDVLGLEDMNMTRLSFHTRRFKPHWTMILLAVLAMALFLRLGFWQLDRAHEKKQMIALTKAFSRQAPTDWSFEQALPAHYQSLRVEGHFLPAVLLLDNQHYQHEFGYDVVSPLMLANGKVVLVDRGFVAGDVTRRLFPATETPLGLVRMTGSAYYPSEKTWLLGQVLEKKNADLAIMEQFDTQHISQFLHKSVYPFIIRLDKHAAHGFVREWPVVAMAPQRHYGYALQWFAIALVILILFIALNLKHVTHENKI